MHRERFKFSVLITRQVAAFVADPQRALGILKQTGDAVALQTRRARAVEDREAHAVEPHQAAVSAQPEIAVARLQHRRHRVVRQSIFRFPGTRKIMRQRGGFRAARRAGEK